MSDHWLFFLSLKSKKKRHQQYLPRYFTVPSITMGGILLVLFLPSHVLCEEEVSPQTIMKGITDSFGLPFADLYHKKHESEWRNLVDGFSGNVIFTYPLKDTEKEVRGGDGQQITEDFRKTTLSATVNYNPLSYWFLSTTFYGYLDFSSSDIYSPESKADWDPDFTYTFGYSDWHPFSMGLVYSNYGGNRLNPDADKGEAFTRFEEGTWTFDWKFVLPESLEHLFVVHETGGVAGSIQYNLTPSFQNLETGTEEFWKQSFSVSVKYTIYKWWYCTYSMYFYPRPWQKQPWDPDFTFGFGYFDWHPGTLSIQYNNYSGNRYPWNDSDNIGDFKDGAITLSWSWKL